MKKGEKNNTKNPSERDFVREYEELFIKIGYSLKEREIEWKKKGAHIKKFSLIKDTPTPILTNNTSSPAY